MMYPHPQGIPVLTPGSIHGGQGGRWGARPEELRPRDQGTKGLRARPSPSMNLNFHICKWGPREGERDVEVEGTAAAGEWWWSS